MSNDNLQKSEEIVESLKKDLVNIQKLKETNPSEYAKKLKEYIDALREFNQATKDLLEFVKE